MPTTPTPVSVTILLNGSTDITKLVNWNDTQGRLALTKQVGTFYFTINATPSIAGSMPTLNSQIDVYVQWGSNQYHYFGGTVTMVEAVVLGGLTSGGITPQLQITATDWSFKLNKLLIAKNYANMDPADIVLDILANYTDGSYGTAYIQRANYLLPSIKFNYQSVTKSIQALATLIGWDWNVDADKNVHFFLVENNPAPFQIDDTTGNLEWKSIDWTQDLTNMKNSVTVIGSTYPYTFTSSTTPDVYRTDGYQNVWALAYAYELNAEAPLSPMTVTLGGVPQTIGNALSDNPALYQVMYNDSARWIQFTSTPAAGQTIQIYGSAIVPIVASASDPVAIAEYGQIQDAISDTKITTIAEAYLRAQADIEQYGHAVNDLKFNTLIPGIFPGQQLTVNSAIFNSITGYSEVVLTVKTVTLAPYSPFQFEYQIEAIGSDMVNFTDIMGLLLQQEVLSTPVTDSTIVENLVPVSETLAVTDSVTYTTTARPYRFGPSYTPQIRYGFFTFD